MRQQINLILEEKKSLDRERKQQKMITKATPRTKQKIQHLKVSHFNMHFDVQFYLLK